MSALLARSASSAKAQRCFVDAFNCTIRSVCNAVDSAPIHSRYSAVQANIPCLSFAHAYPRACCAKEHNSFSQTRKSFSISCLALETSALTHPEPLEYAEKEDTLDSNLFQKCWKKLEEKFGSAIVIPKEIIWLNGPPGAGKGANLGFIKRIRGLANSLSMSRILSSTPEAQSIMDRGGLVSDELVGQILLEAIFAPDHQAEAGVIIDGFPRSGAQVQFVERLYKHLMSLYQENNHIPDLRTKRPKPSFKVVVLYVDEATSLARQLSRQKYTAAHNQKVLEARAGSMMEERDTDKDIEKCRTRYSVFRRHYPALARLQSVMPFSIIDATGSLEECEAQIAHELRYQSSMDLDEETYRAVTRLPLARQVVERSRARLIRRLDDYCLSHSATFYEVADVLEAQVLPAIERNAMAGYLLWDSPPLVTGLLERSELAIDMVVDMLTDRGFAVSHARRTEAVPVRFDTTTGEIHCRSMASHTFRISFPGATVRDVVGLHAQATHKKVRGSESPLLTASVIPEGVDHGRKLYRQHGSLRAQTAALG